MLYRRALTREMALTTGAVLTVLIAIALVVLFIRLLGDVARGELANEAVFAFLGFSLLYFLPVLMTIALFAGVLLPLSRMWRDSEMVIWFNAGLSLTQWMRPVLTFAVPFSLVILLLTLVLNPVGADQEKRISPGSAQPQRKHADRARAVCRIRCRSARLLR